MIFKPRPYQKIIVDHILKFDRCAIWAGMGMGKTSSCLYAINLLSTIDIFNILVVAPLRVARDVWPAEVTKWSNLSHLTMACITGTVEERIAGLHTKANIHTVNYENLPWLLKTVGKQWPWDFIIADESTKLKSFRLRQGGKQSRALAKFAWTKAIRFVELTGTPSSNGLLDLWGQLWFLDKGERLGRTFGAYKKAFFRLRHPNSFQYDCMPFMDAHIHNQVQDICLSLHAKDWFDLKKPIHNNVEVRLPDQCRAQYLKLQRDMFLKIQDTKINAVNAAALSSKCRQFANGAMYDDNKNWVEVHKEKLLALESIVNEWSGENIIVAYEFKSDLVRLKNHFPKGKQLDQQPTTLKKWNAGKIPLLFTHPASAGHGLNLQDGGRIIVFFGQTWNLEHRLQIIERIGPTRQAQAGYDRHVYVYDIITKNTVDILVMQSISDKESIQDALLKAARKDNTI